METRKILIKNSKPLVFALFFCYCGEMQKKTACLKTKSRVYRGLQSGCLQILIHRRENADN
ncbi:hypothetical protein OBV_02430 [Oscillibacter valericigenes Sjm18-20]|nr:hypothetical protein OBV_02430 [Oscillibacter valericigenes Sjm18-20]